MLLVPISLSSCAAASVENLLATGWRRPSRVLDGADLRRICVCTSALGREGGGDAALWLGFPSRGAKALKVTEATDRQAEKTQTCNFAKEAQP